MSKAFSISKARSNLASLVQSAESGEPIELTRRGNAVAAIISIDDYRVMKEKKLFFEQLKKFYEDMEKNGGNPLEGNEFDDLRDSDKGREFSW